MADEYDDEDFIDASIPSRQEYELEAGIQDRTNQVRGLIGRGAFAEAVSKSLEDPPAGRDPQTLKEGAGADKQQAAALTGQSNHLRCENPNLEIENNLGVELAICKLVEAAELGVLCDVHLNHFTTPHPKQDRNLQIVMEALLAPRSMDIPAIVKQLPPAQLDTLMKFVYRGMASPEAFNSAVMLSWHEKVTEVTGLGSIIRVLTDRQTV
ncbi:hypothetical protein HDU98_005357 [Podochytrium sp. JEL0797]|nr:hypothetical protein HDU98_005357 [Podochytrium sp. JEL0797]